MLVGQESAPSSANPRVMTLVAGSGNAMGWFGLQGERYFAGERMSGFVGLGYTPSIAYGDSSGATFAAGLRGFTLEVGGIGGLGFGYTWHR